MSRNVGRGVFGPALVAWTDASALDLQPMEVLSPLGEEQLDRYRALSDIHARRFVTGRWLLAELVPELADAADLTLTTICERCGASHGRPRLTRAPVAVSVSYAGRVVAVAAVRTADASAVGVDIEPEPVAGRHRRLHDLEPLFAPAEPPDIEGWTLLEAAVKADGRGLTIDPAAVRIGDAGTGESPESRAVRIPGRGDVIDAAVIAGPRGFILSAAIAPARAASWAGQHRRAPS
ncbi:hypothetical protein [Microbacterium pumilum]|uniref:4-phosphopantetheinyl transferase n=1 Tax=Microbacterium pumilum TaxID=344165 RepID=A0ABP5D4S8_9MICO